MHVTWTMLVAMGIGGALGAVARFAVSRQVNLWLGAMIPWGTLAVNVLGSFLLGFLVAWFRSRTALSPEWQALWTVGFLGAFTTFSTFSLETIELLNDGEWQTAVFYVVISVMGALLAVWAGQGLARA